MDPQTLTVTAATAQATLPPFWTMLQSLTWLHVFIGVSSATVALILRDYKAVWNILTSAKGKTGIVALEEALPVVLKFLALSGHTAAPATIQQINTIVADGNKALGIPAKPPVSAFGLLFALGLLALGAGLHADVSLGGNFGAGGAVYGLQPGGFFEATGTLAATYGLNLAFTGTTATIVNVPGPVTVTGATPADVTETAITTYNYFILSAGASYEPHTATESPNGGGGYLGAYIQIGTQIPDTPDNIMVGTLGDFFTGAKQPFGGLVSVNFPLGQPWKTWK